MNSYSISTPESAPIGSRTKEYEFLGMIGEGATSQVWLVRRKNKTFMERPGCPSSELCALKMIRMNGTDECIKLVKNELASLKRLEPSFPFIVHLSPPVEALISHSPPDWFLIPLEYVSGGTLYQHIFQHGPVDEPRSRLYAAELGCGLDHLHSSGIIFRDLKTENVLISSDGHLKITDFGLSTIPGARLRTTTICGTPNTIAPEIVRREPYDRRVDWYSLGACLFECLVGQAPFASLSTDLPALLHSIIHRQPKLPKLLSSHSRSILLELLHKSPSKRIVSLDQLLLHPWFLNHHPPFSKLTILNKSFPPSFIPAPTTTISPRTPSPKNPRASSVSSSENQSSDSDSSSAQRSSTLADHHSLFQSSSSSQDLSFLPA